ncbi:MAG: LysM peptidoglycan-binding domain-containing protein [Syntrophaceae bacterium]|nr:LysM peptidoglycan-binding domain-containing protein [Syntrophaceae bacterium]
MIKKFVWTFFVVMFSLIFSSQSVWAQEDTAQITLRKTAVSKENLYTYIVKKGDILSTIVRHIPGVTEADLADNYRLIQELNPHIEDVNKLRVGQKLILPGRPLAEKQQQTFTIADTSPAAPVTPVTGSKTYLIQEGDTLYRIIAREIKDTSNIKEKYKIIKSLNPSIKDINRIYAGETITLPTKDFSVLVAAGSTENKFIESDIDRITGSDPRITMSSEARLAVIKHVLSQMNATVTSTGNYYLPIPKTGQITIDCSKMPVIEFDDSTTVFLDLDNKAPNNLRKIVSDSWSNFHLVKTSNKDDVIVVLRKIFASVKNYGMTNQSKPVTIGSPLTAEFFVDWIITKTDTKQSRPLMQGLRILYGENSFFPKALKNYARKNGFILTEISAQNGIVGKPEEIYSLPPMSVYPSTSAKDFSYALLSDMGLKPEKDVDIKVFSTEKDGINLSIKSDVIVKDAQSQYVIFSRELSPQFINVLTQAGNKLVFVNSNEPPKNTMETVLRALNIPFVNGYFTFSGAEKKQAPFTLNFNGTKIKTSKDLYVIDFDIDHEIRGLLQEIWAANIARY